MLTTVLVPLPFPAAATLDLEAGRWIITTMKPIKFIMEESIWTEETPQGGFS